MSRKSQRAIRAVASLLTDITFRSAEVRRREAEPTGAALILASHAGGLADILLVIHASSRFPRFLARDLIWRVPFGARVMNAVGGIPVHRRQDHAEGVDNSGMFDAAFAALADGDVAAIYPEGESVPEPRLAPLRTGAARIAVGALERGTDVMIVPMGLHFFDVSVLRSRALVDCAEPFPISEVVDGLGMEGPISESNHALVDAVTKVFAERLGAVSTRFDNWEELRRMEVAATTYLQTQRPNERIPYSEIASLTGQLANAPADVRREVDLAATAYVSELELLGVGPLDVPRVAMISARLAGEAAALLLLAPTAAVGFVSNAIGIVGLRLISLSGIAPATAATVKPAYALVTFPLTWAALGYLGFRRAGVAGGVALTVVGPLGLVAAVRVGERGQLIWRLGRAVHRARGPLLDQIAATRKSVIAAVTEAASAQAGSHSEGSAPISRSTDVLDSIGEMDRR